MALANALGGLGPRTIDPDAIVSSASTGPRDANFKLIDIAFLQLMPIARSASNGVVFIATGFDAIADAKLHAIYQKNHVTRFDMAALETLLQKGSQGSGAPSAASPFICLSVHGDASSLSILDRICGGTFRPGLVHNADTNSFANWAEMRQELVRHRYAVVGTLDGAEILVDVPLLDSLRGDDSRPTIATFDVFDTLIARRCVEPWRIFEQVGEMTGLADFVEQRRAAEHRVLAHNYRFDDIYDQLAAHYDWSASERARIQSLELACERNAVVPVAENLARVRDGDLLVSDMYLSESDIRSLLDRAGLTAKVGLLVESHGKSSGRVWPNILAHYNVSRHLGDNPHADVAMPGRAGIDTELTRVTEFCIVEQTLHQAGLRDLALLCREARLTSWHPNPTVRTLQMVQNALNFPLLLLASVSLARRATALGSRSILFSSRDCNLWMPLFDALQQKLGVAFETHYFLTSRLARKKGSAAYLTYARQHLRPDALVVDLCGTGWTMANLAETLNISDCNVFLIDHCPPLDLYERARQTPATCRIHSLFEHRPNVNNIVLELANAADHGMAVDMRAVRESLVPVFAPNPLSMIEEVAITEQRKCFLSAIELLAHYDLREVFELDDASISYLCASLYEYMSRQAEAFNIFAQTFLGENAKIVQTLTT